MLSNLAGFARRLLFPSVVGAVLLIGGPRVLAQPVAISPYTLTAFRGVPPTGATNPDDLAISADGVNLWVGYQNNASTTGQGGNSNLVEYDISSGNVLLNIPIPGHMDGLKIDPTTNNIWATENEDGNPTLAVVHSKTGASTISTFAPDLLTGGMDDLVFSGSRGGVYIVASSQTDITKPVIVKVSS